MRFLDVKTDYAFKRVFGSEQSKAVLLSFLNAVLDYSGEHAIVDLVIVDPYQVPVIQGMKDTYVDVQANLANGKRAIIEMQVLNVKGFEQRILYNAAKAYGRQLQRGEEYDLLNPVIALTLTDFVLFEDSAAHISRFKLLEKDRLTSYSDDIELLFVELPKFVKTVTELASDQDRWLYFVKHAGRLQDIPSGMRTDPALVAAFAMANESALTEEELDLQHKRHDFILLQRGSLEKAELTGLAKGRQEGRQEGRREALVEAVARLVAAGMSEDEARRTLGLG